MVGLTGVLGEVPAPSGKPGHSFGAGRMETSQSQAREGHHLPASSLRGRPTGCCGVRRVKGLRSGHYLWTELRGTQWRRAWKSEVQAGRCLAPCWGSGSSLLSLERTWAGSWQPGAERAGSAVHSRMMFEKFLNVSGS